MSDALRGMHGHVEGDAAPARRRARWRSALLGQRVPEPWPAGAWHCPRCGRPLVGQGRPGVGMLRWEGMTRAQQVAECLVDGTRVNVARRAALQDIDLDAALTDEIVWLR